MPSHRLRRFPDSMPGHLSRPVLDTSTSPFPGSLPSFLSGPALSSEPGPLHVSICLPNAHQESPIVPPALRVGWPQRPCRTIRLKSYNVHRWPRLPLAVRASRRTNPPNSRCTKTDHLVMPRAPVLEKPRTQNVTLLVPSYIVHRPSFALHSCTVHREP